MKLHWLLLAVLATHFFGIDTALCQEKAVPQPPRQTFAIEMCVGRTYNYLDNMIDKDGLPYFNVFWDDPAEAAHDWPDFGDVMSRQLQGATGTPFGFLPEVIGRKGDVISCETCALMDFVGLAVTLANNGHPEYWGDVERMLRNQLVESQVSDVSWLHPGRKPDTEQFTWRDVGARMVGGYAGWSSPTHILAAKKACTGAARNCEARRGPFRTVVAVRARTPSLLPGKMPLGSTVAPYPSICTSTSSSRRPRFAAINLTRACSLSTCPGL